MREGIVDDAFPIFSSHTQSRYTDISDERKGRAWKRSRVDRSRIPPFVTVKTLNLEDARGMHRVDFETRFTQQGRCYSQLRTTRRVRHT